MKRQMSLRCLLVLFALVAELLGQGVGTSGDIKGTIRDSSGTLMQSVQVTIVDTGKGIRRTAVTDSDGQYRVPGLPPANYEVSVAKSGFASQVQKNVVLNLGETVDVPFQMKVSTEIRVIDVIGEPSGVDIDRGHRAVIMDGSSINNLPINRPGYIGFIPLIGGVGNSNTTAGNADFRVKQTPQSGLSIYGSNGRGNSVTVDGGEANDDAGGVRLNVNQDATQEFQINFNSPLRWAGRAAQPSTLSASLAPT